MHALAAFVVAALVSLLLQPLVIRLLRAREILDVPGERSSHRHATPRGGGIAVVVGLTAAAEPLGDAMEWMVEVGGRWDRRLASLRDHLESRRAGGRRSS